MDLETQYDKLLRYCIMKTKDRYLAEELVQETFLRFWNSHSYRDTGKELAYLYTIARNLCIDAYRRPVIEDIEAHAELTDRRYEPEQSLDAMSIEAAMERLPDDLREIVLLRYTNELSVTDIGKILQCSRFSVHRRLKQAVKLLREHLEEGE